MSAVGGMQDWNYLNSNCFEITLELGCFKYPFTKDLPSYWDANKYALLVFMAQVPIRVHLYNRDINLHNLIIKLTTYSIRHSNKLKKIHLLVKPIIQKYCSLFINIQTLDTSQSSKLKLKTTFPVSLSLKYEATGSRVYFL